MGITSDKGMKFDRGKINRILALSIELSDLDLGILINKLKEMQSDRNLKISKGNLDTIST